jgi:phage tail-like protein
MPHSKDFIGSNYPLPAYNYKVRLDEEVLAFSEVSGLNKSYGKVIYKHGLSFLMGNLIIRAQQNPIEFTLKRGVVAKRSNLYNWLTDNKAKDIFIDLCDELGNAIIQWKVINALPLKIEAPAFSSDSNSIALESVEVVAEDLSIEYF